MMDIHDGLTPDVARWTAFMEARPAFRRLLSDVRRGPPPGFTAEERKLLFGERS